MRASACWMPVSKSPRCAPLLVERHQRVDLARRAAAAGTRAAPALETIGRAHAGSSAAVAGRHTKMRVRLGVSPVPVALNGPSDGQRLHAAAGGERRVVAEVREGLVHAGAALPIDERDADRVRAGGDPLAEAPRVRAPSAAAPSSVTSRRRPPSPPPPAAAADGELVLRVEREGVRDEHAAARAERQPLDVPVLRQPGRRRVGDLRRRHRPIADRLAADLHRRRRRSPGSSDGDTLSASAMLSKPSLESSAGSSACTSTSSASRSRIALAYSVRFRRCSAGVSEAGVPADSRRSSRASSAGGERRRASRALGTRRAARRHHAGADLADDLLPHLRRRRRRAPTSSRRAPGRRSSRAGCGR